MPCVVFKLLYCISCGKLVVRIMTGETKLKKIPSQEILQPVCYLNYLKSARFCIQCQCLNFLLLGHNWGTIISNGACLIERALIAAHQPGRVPRLPSPHGTTTICISKTEHCNTGWFGFDLKVLNPAVLKVFVEQKLMDQENGQFIWKNESSKNASKLHDSGIKIGMTCHVYCVPCHSQ